MTLYLFIRAVDIRLWCGEIAKIYIVTICGGGGDTSVVAFDICLDVARLHWMDINIGVLIRH